MPQQFFRCVMRFLLPLYLICLMIACPLMGLEEIDLPEGYSLEPFPVEEPISSSLVSIPKSSPPSQNSIDNLHKNGNEVLTTLGGGPSSSVAGCVNAITGSFFDSQIDLVSPSVHPLVVQRTYCSSEKEWSFRHMPLLTVDNYKTSHIYADYTDDTGSGMRYRRRNSTLATSKLKLPNRLFEEYGLTNCGAEEISGQTNWRNSYLLFVRIEDEKCYLLRHGSHIERIFTRFKRYGDKHQPGAPFGKFHLSEEKHPNGIKHVYDYNDEDELISIKARNLSDQKLCALTIDRKKDQIHWKCSSGDVLYIFQNEQLIQAIPSHGIPVEYTYDKKERVSSKNLPSGRQLRVQYFSSDSKNKGKVGLLSAPVGHDKTLVETHSFKYQSGLTTVSDAEGNLTKYHFDKYKRLQIIKHCNPLDQELSRETFVWATEGDHIGNLLERKFEGADGLWVSRQLKYDEYDNIIEDKLTGNLKGQFADHYIKTFVTSQDDWNLPLEENDGRKQTLLSYYPESNLLKSRFTKADTVLKREFFTYDNNAELSQEIWDDGTGRDPNDLTNVTERHIKITTARTAKPLGLPEIIEEYYYDPISKSNKLLKKIVNSHSPQGKILHQDYYGSDGQHAYTLHWEYDHLGNVVKQVNAIGEITQYQYDENGNKIYEQGPDLSQHKEFVYDYANRLIQEKEIWANGQTLITAHRYNTLNQRIATIDIYGNETTYTYDAAGHPIYAKYPSIYNADNSLVSVKEKRKYDSFGNVTDKWDANDNRTTMHYTARGKPFVIEYADCSSESKQYTIDGLLEKEVARNGLITLYTHDALGHVIQTHYYDPQGILLKVKSATYKADKLISETDESGRTTHFQYDGAGRKIATIQEAHVTTYGYDALGRIAKTIETLDGKVANITIKEYDLLDRVIEERIEDESGTIFQKEQYQYHANGKRSNQIAYTQAGIATTLTTYTPHGEIASVTDALGNVTHFTYNYAYNYKEQCVLQVTRTDPLGNQEIKTHDTHGRVSLVTHCNAFGVTTSSESYIYDPAGNRLFTYTTVFTPNAESRQIITENQYDTMDNMVHSIEAKGTPEQKHTRIWYNRFGQKERILTPNGVTLLHKYDLLGRLTHFQSSDDSISYSYNYDCLDRPIYIRDLIKQTGTFRSYDCNGNLRSERLGTGHTISCTYDALKRPLLVTLPDNSTIRYSHNALHLEAVTRNTYTTTYTHDLAGNILQQTLGQIGTIDYQYDLLSRPIKTEAPHWKETVNAYDAVGNLLERQVTDSQGTCQYRYTYEDLYQLTSETGSTPHNYQHDSICNRVAKNGNTYQVNALNQLLAQTDHHYRYDANGCLLEETKNQEQVLYRYDALDRLIEVQTPQNKITYTYDSFNRRLSKTANGITTHYLYHGQNEIGAMVEGKITELRILGNGRGAEVGAAVALELQGELFIPVNDSFGNIVALMDSSGNLVESYRYTAFGEIQVFSKKVINNPWRYSSKRFDPETGFYYFGQRYYSPEIGRWITPDPAGFADGPNLYAYVHNRPLHYIDPDGRFAMFLLPMLIGFAADYCLPAASAYLAQYAGGTAVAGLLTGVVRGYNGSLFEPSTFGAIDPVAGCFEAAGLAVGTLLSLSPGKVAGKVGTVAANTMTRLATKEAVHVTENAIAQKVKQKVAWTATEKVAKRTLVNAESGVLKNGAKLELDALSKAGQVADRGGLTRVGRALDKHGNRPNSVFPKAFGNPANKNIQGQFHLDDILTHPKTFTKSNKFGGLNYYAPDGRGACFDLNGNFRGFLQP